MSDPEQAPRVRRIPPLTYPGLFFVLLAFLADDVWALYAGGALLAIASLQWGRGPS